MGKLDHLKIKSCPAAFAPFARNFNQQVDLLGSIHGGPGVDVQIAHSPQKRSPGTPGQPKPKEQPRGKILFTLRPSAVSGIGVGSGAGGNSNTVNTNCVAADGSLTLLSVPSATLQPNTFPTRLYVQNGNTFSYFDGDGMQVQFPNSHGVGITPSFGFTVGNAFNYLGINFGDITKDMGIKTFVGCNSGNAANYLVVASDFF
jgi:hypothetical protein